MEDLLKILLVILRWIVCVFVSHSLSIYLSLTSLSLLPCHTHSLSRFLYVYLCMWMRNVSIFVCRWILSRRKPVLHMIDCFQVTRVCWHTSNFSFLQTQSFTLRRCEFWHNFISLTWVKFTFAMCCHRSQILFIYSHKLSAIGIIHSKYINRKRE